MNQEIQITLDALSDQILLFILQKAEEWECQPTDALIRILNEQADDELDE